jgi:hypothetical protein
MNALEYFYLDVDFLGNNKMQLVDTAMGVVRVIKWHPE